MAADPYRYFRIEAAELTEQLGQGVLELERSPPDGDTVARLLRAAHTLKGAARVVQEIEIAERAHTIEEVLAGHRGSDGPLTGEQVARLLGLLDATTDRIATLGQPAQTQPARTQPAVGPAAGRAPTTGSAPTAGPTQDAAPAPATGSAGPDTMALEAASGWRADSGDVEALLETVVETCAQVASLPRAVASLAETSRDLSGAAANDLVVLGRHLGQTVERTERGLRQIRSSAERLRLVPAGALFPALRRAVRDVASVQGKRVDFVCSGGEIRVDPYVLSAVYGAMLHVVRNAVAHGIEPEPRRTAAGKPAAGAVSLAVTRRGSRVRFSCRDDGRGFDLDAVRRVAQRGATEIQDADRDDLLALVLSGGITTSGAVTEVSGRGVGLDVARDVAERLGGTIAARTETGLGATVEIEVPLSLVSFDGLLVVVAGVTAAIPLESVRHCLRLESTAIARTGMDATVNHEGRAVPFVPLASVLAPAETTPTAVRGPEPAVTVVVVAADEGTAAFGVDRLLGTEPVVMRSLPDLAPAAEVVGGLCVDADGDPRVVLDPHGLVRLARRGGGSTGPFPGDEAPVQGRRGPILVIDDSLTTRMLERSILESAGHDVDVACSGEEALDKARTQRYSVFLVDIEMPGMDGFMFIERVRADPELRDIPSILISSRASDEDRQRGIRAGARMHVAKGEFDQNRLLRAIDELVR